LKVAGLAAGFSLTVVFLLHGAARAAANQAPPGAATEAAAAPEVVPVEVAPPPEESAPAGASVMNEGRAKAEGDDSFDGEGVAGTYTIRTLVQTRVQESFTSVDPAVAARVRGEIPDAALAAAALGYLDEVKRGEDGLRLNRVFLRAVAQPTSYLGVKLMVDFAELVRGKEKKALKLAFAELSPKPTLAFTVGLFKIPFSLLELLPIADYELAESGPADKLLKNLGFAGRDVGAMVSLAPLRKKKLLRLHAGVFRGDAVGAQDSRSSGLLAARATTKPMKHVRLGVDFVWRPKPVLDWEDTAVYRKFDAGHAISADAIVDWKPVELRAEWLMGDRTDNQLVVPLTLRRRGDARSFMGAWALVAARIPVGDMVLIPAARGEWLDTDRQSATGGIVTLSAGINLDVIPNVRLLLDVTRIDVQPLTYSIDDDVGTYDVDATTIVGQVQVKL
jgi:hypothetical protein